MTTESKNIKIDKDSSGKTSYQALPNQVIIYDPKIDSYIIETEVDSPVGTQLHTSKISRSILEFLFKETWEERLTYLTMDDLFNDG